MKLWRKPKEQAPARVSFWEEWVPARWGSRMHREEVNVEFLRFRLARHKIAMLEQVDAAWNAALEDLARSMNAANKP